MRYVCFSLSPRCAFLCPLPPWLVGFRTLERRRLAWHRANGESQRLETIPGVGSGRPFAACLGLVSRQISSGGKRQLGRIPKRGQRHPATAAGGGRHLGDPQVWDHANTDGRLGEVSPGAQARPPDHRGRGGQ